MIQRFKDFDTQKRINHFIGRAKLNSRNIPRSDMPQITKENTPEFYDFLKSHKIYFRKKRVHSTDIGFAQGEFHKDKIEHLVKDMSVVGDRVIFVSRDMVVLDGNHRILANQVNNDMVNVLVIDLPIVPLIALLKTWNKTEYRK